MPKEVTRHVSDGVQRILWGKAAGRCEFAGCNRPLWKSSVTQEQVNIAQKAHIYSCRADGPRGNESIQADKVNDLSNLMLVCHECHRKMDQEKDGGRYPAELLQRMKASHERRIETVTGVHPDRRSHVVLYGTAIGDHNSPLSFNAAAMALFPERYPADDMAIELPTVNSWARDRDQEFWRIEDTHLVKMFEKRVRERLADGSVNHLSVFALAPQPLLTRLGVLLTDIPDAEIFARHREPQGWEWRDHPAGFSFVVREPEVVSGPPALVLSLSATVSKDRIAAVIGSNATFWTVTIPEPHNDFLQSRHQLQEFRDLARRLMVKIKAAHGHDAVLHIFPAAPAAISVELGRIRMPKADLKWQVWDQVNARGGFVSAISIT